MKIEGGFDIEAEPQTVWEKITDAKLMVGCIPGCEQIEEIDPTHYRAIVAVSIGIIKARFNLLVEIIREDPPHAIYTRTTGDEGTRASMVSAETVLRLEKLTDGHTRVQYTSDVDVTGRLGKFGLGIMRKQAAVLGDDFARNFQRKLRGETHQENSEKAVGSGTKKILGRLFNRKSPLEGTSKDRPVEDADKAKASTNWSNKTVLRPDSVEEAVEMLAKLDDALPLSGGATLIAMKNANLVQARRFVSLEAIAEMQGIQVGAQGAVRIGAMTRHRDTAGSQHLIRNLSVLSQAAGMIANPPVRNMGTIGGSVANADPAADYLAALVCLDAELELAGPSGRRTIPISEFLVNWYETALQPAEIIVAVHLPPASEGLGSYRKIARVSGDYATASCAISVKTEPGLTIQIAIGGCGPFPVRDREAEANLVANELTDEAIAEFGEHLASLADPIDDVRGSAEYRRRLIPRLVTQAIGTMVLEREAVA